ncbi:hypothetical protein L6452_33835 [Arctium lappa]|uniref:Uncharacterized protein n=1 Tax=Arctium lappa TaxID=4217 RepID=A0ACB8YHP4_ARCLA|nr:hypothetical protein L6452_33835 [Arctium lappa]
MIEGKRISKTTIEEKSSEVWSEMYTYNESYSATTTTTSFATDLKRGEIGIGIEIDEKLPRSSNRRAPSTKLTTILSSITVVVEHPSSEISGPNFAIEGRFYADFGYLNVLGHEVPHPLMVVIVD